MDDQQSWQEFFDAYWKLIYSVALKAGLSDAEAQEVVQETVISVAKKMPEFKADPAVGSFKSWLLTLTRWRITDQMRKRARSGQALQSAGSHDAPVPRATGLESPANPQAGMPALRKRKHPGALIGAPVLPFSFAVRSSQQKDADRERTA